MEHTQQALSARPIARWNSGRDCWETDQVDLLSGLSVVFSETFPISGSMRSGVVSALPMSEHHMGDSGSLFSQLGGKLLPTATAQDSAASGGSNDSNVTLTDAVVRTNMGTTPNERLLPTPDAYAADRGGSQHPQKRRAGGHSVSLSDVTEHLLPTPKAGDADFGMPRTSGRPPEKSTHLMTRLAHTSPNAMLPTPRATRGGSATEMAYGLGGERSNAVRAQGNVEIDDASWGPYAAAIERWEYVSGRRAPDPTEAGPKGGRRLASRFVEWLMGLPDGWVTGIGVTAKVPAAFRRDYSIDEPEQARSITRSQELKMLGNGVVPQQAIYALMQMKGTHE